MFLHEGGQKVKVSKMAKVKGDPLKPLAPLLRNLSLPDGTERWFVKNAKNL